MEPPQIRAGRVEPIERVQRVIAFFPTTAMGNMAIQLLVQLGVPSDHLGVTPPEQIDGSQGLILSIPCVDPGLTAKIESTCRAYGARIHRQKP